MTPKQVKQNRKTVQNNAKQCMNTTIAVALCEHTESQSKVDVCFHCEGQITSGPSRDTELVYLTKALYLEKAGWQVH